MNDHTVLGRAGHSSARSWRQKNGSFWEGNEKFWVSRRRVLLVVIGGKKHKQRNTQCAPKDGFAKLSDLSRAPTRAKRLIGFPIVHVSRWQRAKHAHCWNSNPLCLGSWTSQELLSKINFIGGQASNFKLQLLKRCVDMDYRGRWKSKRRVSDFET